MTADGTGWRALRAASALRFVVTALALYALVLSSLLGGIASVSASAPDGILCQKQAGPPLDDTQPATAHHDATCCTTTCVGAAVPPRDASATAIVWPSRPSLRVAWWADAVAEARAPPRTAHSQRGPPAA